MCQECEEDGLWSGLDKPAVTAPHLPSGLFHSCVPISSGFVLGGAHTELGSPPGCQELGKSQSPCPQRVHPHGNSMQPSITRLPARFFLATAAILGLCCPVPVAYFDPEGSAWCLGKDLEVLCQLVRDQGWKNTNLTPHNLIFFDFIEAFGQEKPKSQHGPKGGVRGCSHVPPSPQKSGQAPRSRAPASPVAVLGLWAAPAANSASHLCFISAIE